MIGPRGHTRERNLVEDGAVDGLDRLQVLDDHVIVLRGFVGADPKVQRAG